MTVLMAVMVGLLFAASMYLVLRRSVVKLIIGLAMMGHAANLLIFTSAGLKRGNPPLIEPDQYVLEGTPVQDFTDPLPPALILTAIVISFAIVSFAAVLVKRTYEEVGTDDLDAMRSTDEE